MTASSAQARQKTVAMIRFDMPYPPSVNHYYVRTPKGTAVGAKGKKYRRDVGLMLTPFKHKFKEDDRLSVTINVFPPDKRKHDLDNILKCCLDSLQESHVIHDDNQIDMLTIIRRDVIKAGYLSLWITVCD